MEALLKKDPGDVDVLLYLAEAVQAKGQARTALDMIEKILKLDLKAPDRDRALLAKASLKATVNDLKTAKDICFSVLNRHQGNTHAHYVLGKILLNTGKTEEAEIHLNQVAGSQPNDVQAQILLAESQLLNKKDSLAADTLSAAIKANPGSDDLRLAYARMLMVQKSFDQAVNILGQGLENNPGDISLA